MDQDQEMTNAQEEELEELYDVETDGDEFCFRLERTDVSVIEAIEGYAKNRREDALAEGRKLYLQHYNASFHGVDVVLQDERMMEQETLENLIECIKTALADPEAVIDPFYNRREHKVHLLIVSRHPLLKVIKLLPEGNFYSVMPAFVTDEENLPACVYLYLSLGSNEATALATW